jgi:hypothetical protein
VRWRHHARSRTAARDLLLPGPRAGTGNTKEALEFYDRVFSLDINFADVTEQLRAPVILMNSGDARHPAEQPAVRLHQAPSLSASIRSSTRSGIVVTGLRTIEQ